MVLELFPLDRQPFPFDERTPPLSLSLSLSLLLGLLGRRGAGIRACKSYFKECKYSTVLFGTPSFFGSIEPLFYVTMSLDAPYSEANTSVRVLLS